MPGHALNPVLLKRTDEVGLSPRSAECLRNANIVYIGELVQMSHVELLRAPHVGRKSLDEIMLMLAGLGLHLCMEVSGWPPDNIE
jgi:DNA-directed RNA polymerase subunit alpha